MAATTGIGMSSTADMTCRRLGSCVGCPNSVMSAPPLNARAVPARTTALTEASPRRLSSAARMPLRSARPSAFTGGLFIVRTATSPSRSTVTGP